MIETNMKHFDIETDLQTAFFQRCFNKRKPIFHRELRNKTKKSKVSIIFKTNISSKINLNRTIANITKRSSNQEKNKQKIRRKTWKPKEKHQNRERKTGQSFTKIESAFKCYLGLRKYLNQTSGLPKSHITPTI